MTDDELKRFFYNRLRPEEPLPPGDERWVDLSPASANLLEPLLQRIEIDDSFTYQLVTGFIGTGKSTELARLVRRLEANGFTAVYSRAEPLVNEFGPTQIGEVLAYIAYALDQADMGSGPLGTLVDTAKSVLTGVELEGLELSGGPAKLKLALGRSARLSDRVREVAREQAGPLFTQLVALIESAQKRLRERGEPGLVLIIDVLDHLIGHPETAAEVEESVRHVLLERTELRRLPAHLILTVPPAMIRYGETLGQFYSGELMVMPSIHTRHKDDEPDPQGVNIMVQFVAKRAGGIDALHRCFGLDLKPLLRLVAASGGSLRDLLRLVRNCLVDAQSLPIARDVADGVIARAGRPLRENLFDEYRPHIDEMMKSPERRFPRSAATWPLLQSLFRDQVVLRYHNADYWEALNPLALRYIDVAAFDRLLSTTEEVAVTAE